MVKSAVLSAWLLLLPSLALAHTKGLVDKTCPICGTEFKAEMDLSGTKFGVRLDFKPLGPIEAPWRLAVCPQCNFVLYKDDLTSEKREKLRDFLQSDQYGQLVNEKHTTYFLLAHILTHMGFGDFAVGYAYLKASWQVEGEAPQRHRAYLENCLANMQRFMQKTKERDEDWKNAQVLIGEIFRRLSRFDEARRHFEALAEVPEFAEQPFRAIREYQLELIEKRDHAPRPLPSVELTQDDIRKTPAYEMLEASPTLSPFADLFEVSDLLAGDWHTAGVYLSGAPEWSGRFVPKSEVGCPAMARLVFQIGTDEIVHAGLTPQEVLDALREVCGTLFVRELVNGADSGRVRLRAAGDRLHWSTKKVERYRSILRQNGIETPSAKSWMKFILDLRDGAMISLYHPKGSTVFVVDYWSFDESRRPGQYVTAICRELGAYDQFPRDQLCPLVDSEGNLRLLPSKKTQGR